jgi:transcriptional regulator with XRE-family HTH domain
MSGTRPVGPADQERGERLTALRKLRWGSQGAFVRDSGMDRVQVLRLESGQDRFTSPTVQSKLAQAHGVSVGALVAYARGEMSIDDLRAGAREKPAEAQSTTMPASWRAARPLILVRIGCREELGPRAEAYAQAVVQSIDEDAGAFASHGVEDWLELSERRLALLTDGSAWSGIARNPGHAVATSPAPKGSRARR